MTDNDDIPDEGHDSTDSHEESDTDPSTDADLSLTPTARELLLAERGRTCTLCGTTPSDSEDIDLHIHHKQPQSEGGTDHPRNLAVVCDDCHGRYHNIRSSSEVLAELTDDATNTNTDGDADADSEASVTNEQQVGDGDSESPQQPLPPQSEPTERDGDVLDVIDDHGPVRTGVIAEAINCSTQYTRVLLWKLAGEDLIARTTDDKWDVQDRVDEDETYEGLPEDPELAYQAGRDEMIRRMAANNVQQGEIADIAGCSRSTVRNAVNRARALAVPINDDIEIADMTADSMAVASQLRRLARVLDTHDDSELTNASEAETDQQ